MQKALSFEFCNTVGCRIRWWPRRSGAPIARWSPTARRPWCSTSTDRKAGAGADIRIRRASAVTVSMPMKGRDLSRLDGCAAAWRKAFDAAKVGLDDLDFVETHDCFTIAELMQYEAMGLAAPGARRRCAGQRRLLSGRAPAGQSVWRTESQGPSDRRDRRLDACARRAPLAGLPVRRRRRRRAHGRRLQHGRLRRRQPLFDPGASSLSLKERGMNGSHDARILCERAAFELSRERFVRIGRGRAAFDVATAEAFVATAATAGVLRPTRLVLASCQAKRSAGSGRRRRRSADRRAEAGRGRGSLRRQRVGARHSRRVAAVRTGGRHPFRLARPCAHGRPPAGRRRGARAVGSATACAPFVRRFAAGGRGGRRLFGEAQAPAQRAPAASLLRGNAPACLARRQWPRISRARNRQACWAAAGRATALGMHDRRFARLAALRLRDPVDRRDRTGLPAKATDF